jgi:hypothetical protein
MKKVQIQFHISPKLLSREFLLCNNHNLDYRFKSLEGLWCTVHRVPECLSLRKEFGLPTPSPSLSPLGPKGGGATLAWGWDRGGPISGDWTERLALCILCA